MAVIERSKLACHPTVYPPTANDEKIVHSRDGIEVVLAEVCVIADLPLVIRRHI